MEINYISTQSLQEISGGWSGMNLQIYTQLKRYFNINYIGPINPPVHKYEKIKSKLLRIIGLPGNFFFFSNYRLDLISNKIQKEISIKPFDAFFFHGSTPWLGFKPLKPYYAYLDASFYTYLKIYSNPAKFRKSDIERIFKLEAHFLKHANQIFFSSQWALNEAKEKYQISGKNFSVVGLGGNLSIPSELKITNTSNLLFISVDFYKKGGLLVVSAFKKLKDRYPQLLLNIVGERPPYSVLRLKGIVYHGFLNKKIPEDLEKLESIFKNTFCLIHPTMKDMTPLVIIEAGYFGIPCLAPAKFGIPEMIIDRENGFLLKNLDVESIVAKVTEILSNNEYSTLKKSVQDHFIKNFTWDRVGEKMRSNIELS